MSRVSAYALALLFAALLVTAPARAYTPESGVWWNPAEPGTGLLIEIQDNYVAVFAYVYDQAGNPTWFTSNGFLTGNALYQGQLDRFTGGQCIGCAWRQNNPQLGQGGSIRIAFNPNNPTRATLTWGGRTTQIERFHFYLKRPEDQTRMPGVRSELTKMLGEWQAVLDYSNHPTAPQQYYGEIVILDRLSFDNDGDFVDGCRAANSTIGYCRTVDLNSRYAAVEYVASSNSHVMVVDNSATTFAAYFLKVGTNEFEGEVSVYSKVPGTIPTVFYPVNGFRTASRTFVQEGVGPSKSADDSKAVARSLPLPAASKEAPPALDADMQATLRMLEARLQGGSSR
jgi:hypothetical protein